MKLLSKSILIRRLFKVDYIISSQTRNIDKLTVFFSAKDKITKWKQETKQIQISIKNMT